MAVMGPAIGVGPPNLQVPWWYHSDCFVAGLKENHPDVPLSKLHPELFDGYGSVETSDLEEFRGVSVAAIAPQCRLKEHSEAG